MPETIAGHGTADVVGDGESGEVEGTEATIGGEPEAEFSGGEEALGVDGEGSVGFHPDFGGESAVGLGDINGVGVGGVGVGGGGIAVGAGGGGAIEVGGFVGTCGIVNEACLGGEAIGAGVLVGEIEIGACAVIGGAISAGEIGGGGKVIATGFVHAPPADGRGARDVGLVIDGVGEGGVEEEGDGGREDELAMGG